MDAFAPGSWQHDRLPPPFHITASLLRRVFPATTRVACVTFADPLTRFMMRFEIDTIRRMSAFFGQIAVESSQLRVVEENLTYTTEDRLREVFGNKLPIDSLSNYVRSPSRLANRVYAGMGGNGDESSGDGFSYRGRGLIQLTLKDNYKSFAEYSRVDVVSDPDLVAQPHYAAWSACWYWHVNRLNSFADTRDFRRLTGLINKRQLHLEERIQAIGHADSVLRHELGVLRW
jgi:putative chitinase